jgi:hypothetical protein
MSCRLLHSARCIIHTASSSAQVSLFQLLKAKAHHLLQMLANAAMALPGQRSSNLGQCSSNRFSRTSSSWRGQLIHPGGLARMEGRFSQHPC